MFLSLFPSGLAPSPCATSCSGARFFMLFMSSPRSSLFSSLCQFSFLSSLMPRQSSTLAIVEALPRISSLTLFLSASFSCSLRCASTCFSRSRCEARLQRSFLKQALRGGGSTACLAARIQVRIQAALQIRLIIFIKMLTNQHRVHQLLAKPAPSLKEREELLRLIRTGRYDLPECVFENAFTLLKNGSSEQRFYQANDLIQSGMELGVGSKLKGYLLRFKAALGDVPYVRKLAALLDFTTSSEPTSDHFGESIVEDRTNYDSKKQSLTAHKLTYDWDDYVASLNRYLEENPNDAEAWMELGDLYSERSQYLRAIFCYEEVVVLTPDNDYYFLRLAELYYTDGGKLNFATAAKYFSYVVSRNPHNPRALWGLWRSLSAQKDALSEQDRELMQKVNESIHKLYSQKNPELKIHLAF